MDFLKSHIKLCLKTLYTKRHRENQGWSFADEDVKLLNKDAHFSVSVSMHSLILTGYGSLFAMLRKTTLGECMEFLKMAQLCCSRFQPLSFGSFQLQGRMGHDDFIQCSKNKLGSLPECWLNTEVDGLMKLKALSRLSLRCIGFWFGGISRSKDVVDASTKYSGIFGRFVQAH